MIRVDDLHKSYQSGKVLALRGISFEVGKGEIFGVIGPDGAGKSTLFRILCSLLLPDGGSATLDGWDVVRDYKELRKIIGYMPGRFSLYEDLTVEENLHFFATLFNTTIAENYHLISDIYQQIEPFKQRRAGNLSGGMKQKLALSCALIHKPKVLILDEPTTGVDPVSRKEFWEMLSRLKEQGITILVSTAYMDEASQCDRIALIQEGKFMTVDTPRGIVNSYSEILWAVEGGAVAEQLRRLRKLDYVRSCFAFGDKIHVTVTRGSTFSQLVKDLGGSVEVYQITPTVEDAFMALSGNE